MKYPYPHEQRNETISGDGGSGRFAGTRYFARFTALHKTDGIAFQDLQSHAQHLSLRNLTAIR